MANLADLQAELLRKKTELKQKSFGEGNYVKREKSSSSSPSIFAKKNKGVAERSEKDAEDDYDDDV